MKRQALHHTKLDSLMCLLKIPRWGAVGILESLWHLTAREAPTGDIGRLSDERIARGIDWRSKKPAELVSALIQAGWIDVDPQPGRYRLIVHGWSEHADATVHKYIQRNKLKFACLDISGHDQTFIPSRARGPEPVPVPAPEPEPEPHAARRAELDLESWVRQLHDSHPGRKGSLAEARINGQAVLQDSADIQACMVSISENHSRWCDYWKASNTEPKYIPNLCNWFIKATPQGRVFPCLEPPPKAVTETTETQRLLEGIRASRLRVL